MFVAFHNVLGPKKNRDGERESKLDKDHLKSLRTPNLYVALQNTILTTMRPIVVFLSSSLLSVPFRSLGGMRMGVDHSR